MHRREFLALGVPLIAVTTRGFQAAVQGGTSVQVRQFGAKGDGRTNDTAAFARAMRALVAGGGGRVLVDDGVFLIDADVDAGQGVRLGSHCTLEMSKGAVLRAIPNSLKRSAVVLMAGVTDAHVIGGMVIGERTQHRGTEGEWGMGVWMTTAHQCSVRSTVIKECWGDGIYVGSDSPSAGTESTDIVLDGVHCDHNRRQGASIVAARRVHILNSQFTRTSGTAPSAGIDFEPDAGRAVVDDCLVEGCTLDDNLLGVQVVGPCRRVVVRTCRLRGNRRAGITLLGDVVSCRVENNAVGQEDDTSVGVLLAGAHGAHISNNVVRGSFKTGVLETRRGTNTLTGNRSTRVTPTR